MSEAPRAAWLAPGVLAVLARVDGAGAGTRWRLLGAAGGGEIGLPARWLDLTDEPDRLDRWWLLTALLPDALDGERLESLSLEDGRRAIRLPPGPIDVPPGELARAIRHAFAPPARGRVQAFLAATPAGHGIELDRELAATLALIRDVVREPLPGTAIAPGPLALRLETVTAVDVRGFWLSGWIHVADPRSASLTAVSPEGARVDLDPGAVTYHPRPAYAASLGDDGTVETVGFDAYLDLPSPSRHPHGWLLELRTAAGAAAEDRARKSTVGDHTQLWNHILGRLGAAKADSGEIAGQLQPALVGLRRAAAGAGAGAGAGDRSSASAQRGGAGSRIERLEVVGGEGAASTVSLSVAGTGGRHDAFTGTYSFAVQGSVEHAVVAVEARYSGVVLRRVELDNPPGKAPEPERDSASSARDGFRLVLGSLTLPPRFEVAIDAVSAAGTVRLGTVRGRRRELRTDYVPTLQPLLIRTMGRSGSDRLMSLLSMHPQIVAYQPIAYEPRLADYWIGVLRSLSEPVSYMQTILPQVYGDDWWLGRGRPDPPPVSVPEPAMPRWLGVRTPEALAAFCQQRLNEFYTACACGAELQSPAFFAEKTYPGCAAQLIGELYPNGRQLLLVRDFRDMFCSIRDYNRRRGLQQWRHDPSETDAEWISGLRGMVDEMLLDRPGARLVRYEDLIATPGATLTEILRHVGVDAGAGTVAQMIAGAQAASPERLEAEHRTSRDDAASVGRWKRDLTPELQAACAASFEDLLLEFGYEPTSA
jgi:hypothetical protein